MPTKPPLPRPPKLAEARMVAGYLGFWRVLDRLVRRHVLPVLKAPVATPERRDAAPRSPGELKAAALAAVDKVRIEFAQEVDGAAVAKLCATVGGRIDAHNYLEQSGLGRVIGVDIVRTDKHLRRELPKWTATNTALIRRTGGLSDKACGEIGAVVRAGFEAGTRHEAIARDIEQRLGVARSRAVLIARDQTNKLNGQLSADRQIDAGVTHYVWSSARDERVRPTHIALEGQVVAWSDPPPEGHPGAPIQCRCVAVPTTVNAKGERRGPNVGASAGKAGAATLPAVSVFNPAKQPLAPVLTSPAWLTSAFAPSAAAAAPAPAALPTLSLVNSTDAEKTAFYEAEADEFKRLMDASGAATADVWQKFLAPAGGSGLTPAQLDVAVYADPSLSAAHAASVDDARSRLQRMISRDAVDRYGLERLATSRGVTCSAIVPRAFYMAGTVARDAINVGDGKTATVLHELGHWLETRAAHVLGDKTPDTAIPHVQNSIVRRACNNFLDRRATSTVPKRLSALTGLSAYGANEVALPDKFINAYVGKVYASGDTEVFSIGLEHLGASWDIETLHKADKEHLGLILSILRGRVIP